MRSTLAGRAVDQNPWIRVRQDQVRRPDGGTGIYGVVEVRSPAVCVVAVTDDESLGALLMGLVAPGRVS